MSISFQRWFWAQTGNRLFLPGLAGFIWCSWLSDHSALHEFCALYCLAVEYAGLAVITIQGRRSRAAFRAWCARTKELEKETDFWFAECRRLEVEADRLDKYGGATVEVREQWQTAIARVERSIAERRRNLRESP